MCCFLLRSTSHGHDFMPGYIDGTFRLLLLEISTQLGKCSQLSWCCVHEIFLVGAQLPRQTNSSTRRSIPKGRAGETEPVQRRQLRATASLTKRNKQSCQTFSGEARNLNGVWTERWMFEKTLRRSTLHMREVYIQLFLSGSTMLVERSHIWQPPFLPYGAKRRPVTRVCSQCLISLGR